MIEQKNHINERNASIAFSKQSVLFDELYKDDTIVDFKRNRVRDHVYQFIKPQSHILELNAGTGDDAIYFARQGHRVHATDISEGMQAQLKKKVQLSNLSDAVTTELCSYTLLNTLHYSGPYDYLFSNFAGLNCTHELEKVLKSISPLIKEKGVITLVILPKFCLWEFLLIGKGKFKTALRRFCGKKGARSHIEGEYFRCWYYNPGFVKKIMAADYEHLQTEGLCTFVPPSYISNFAEKYSAIYNYFTKKELQVCKKWPWRSIGDYYIISFRKK